MGHGRRWLQLRCGLLFLERLSNGLLEASEGFVILMVSVEFFRLSVATLEVEAELLVFLCS